MGKYRFRLSDMMPNAWFYKLKDMSHGARNNPNHRGGHHHHHHHKKKRRPSNSSASASTSASNASAAPSHIVPRLSNPPYNKYHSPSYRSHSPRLSDLYSPRNHKASDIPLPPPTPSSPTSRISSSSSTSIMLSNRSKSRKSLGHMPSPSPTRRPQQQQQEETIIPPTTSRSLVTSNNTCNHHHMRYYSLSDGSPHDSLLWDESNSYCHHRHNNNSNIYGLVSSDEVGSRISDSCRVSSSTADVIIDLNMDEDSYTNSEFQLVSEALDHELNSPTVLTDPAAIFNAYLDENNSTAGSRTGTMITTTTTTTTTTSSKKSSCSKGQKFEEIECGVGPSSLHQLSVRINYVRSEERNISSSKRSCKESAVKSNEVSSCSKYSSSSRRSRTVTMNTSAPPAAGPGGIRGVKLRLGTRTPRIACNKKVMQAQAKNGTRKSIILSANSPRRRMNSKNSKSTRRSSSCATSLSQSFAVVKSSCDPQRDFRESMTEMIVENNIRASRDLEDLLACYLTLNANQYHQLILKAFEQIWFHMFYDDDPSITDLN